MKRVHTLMQLGRTVSQESAGESNVVTQPTEGAPTVQSTDAVLAQQAAAADAEKQTADAIPADGAVPAEDIQGVSQESQSTVETAPVATETKPENDGKQSDADGSQPATPSDEPGDEAGRADLGKTQQPAAPAADPNNPSDSVSTEDNSTVETAPVSTETTPSEDNKPSDADGSKPAAASDAPGDDAARADQPQAAAGTPAELAPELEQRDPAQSGNPTFKETAPQSADVAADPNNPALEQLSPEDVAQVAAVAAAAGAAAAGGTAAPAAAAAPVETAPADDAVPPADDMPPADTAPAADAEAGAVAAEVTDAAAEETGATQAADAAQQAADAVAAEPDAETPPGENAGEAAATPAEAAQVVADLIADNPDSATAIAAAVDKVADAAVMAEGGAGAIAENVDAGAAAADAAGEGEGEDEGSDAEDAMSEDDEDLDDLDELEDDVEVATESLMSARDLLTSLESIVETALQNGGLSDDAAQILQQVTDHVTNEVDADPVDLGLESLAYTDRLVATDYALTRLRAAQESIDADLNVSTEGFFDIFRSFAGKSESWAKNTIEACEAARKNLNGKSEPIEVKVDGPASGSLASNASTTFSTLTAIVGPFNAEVRKNAVEMAEIVKTLNNGKSDYNATVAKMDAISLQMPSVFNTIGTGGAKRYSGKATPVLLGGRQLVMKLTGESSVSECGKTGTSATIRVTPQEVSKALGDVEKYAHAVIDAVAQYKDTSSKVWDSAQVASTTAQFFASHAVTLAIGMLISADTRRAVKRQFTKDSQGDKVTEVGRAFETVKNAIKVGRVAAAEVLSIAKKFK